MKIAKKIYTHIQYPWLAIYSYRSPNNANLKKHFTHIQATAAMIFSIRTPVLISKLAAISNQSSSININRQLSSYSRQLKTLSQTQQIATGVQIIPTCMCSPIATLFVIPLLILVSNKRSIVYDYSSWYLETMGKWCFCQEQIMEMFTFNTEMQAISLKAS